MLGSLALSPPSESSSAKGALSSEATRQQNPAQAQLRHWEPPRLLASKQTAQEGNGIWGEALARLEVW